MCHLNHGDPALQPFTSETNATKPHYNYFDVHNNNFGIPKTLTMQNK